MADVKWIKIVTDIFDDEKILLIETLPDADSIIVIWFKMLCLAGKQNNDGILIMSNRLPYTEKMLASIFRRNENTVKLALATFEEFGMIEIVNDTITIPNWSKHQSLDKLEKIKEQNKKRIAEYRERKKQNDDVESDENSNAESNVTVTLRNATDKIRLDKNRLDKIRLEESTDNIISDKPKRFTKPCIDEIKSYCIERKNNVNADKFFDYYESNGWKVGKSAMKDWKASIRSWERNGYDKPEKKANKVNAEKEHSYDLNEFDDFASNFPPALKR